MGSTAVSVRSVGVTVIEPAQVRHVTFLARITVDGNPLTTRLPGAHIEAITTTHVVFHSPERVAVPLSNCQLHLHDKPKPTRRRAK